MSGLKTSEMMGKTAFEKETEGFTLEQRKAFVFDDVKRLARNTWRRKESFETHLDIECNHTACEQIGQYALRSYGGWVQTYFACHDFKRGHLSIYFKKPEKTKPDAITQKPKKRKKVPS